MKNIEQTYNLDASPATVFEYLTDPERLDAWWTSKAISEPRKGGAFRYEWRFTPEAPMDDHVQEGTYDEFEAPRLLAYPWNAGQETRVAFKITPDGEGSRLDLVHSNLPEDQEVVQKLTGGWQFFIGNLVTVIGGGADIRPERGLIIG